MKVLGADLKQFRKKYKIRPKEIENLLYTKNVLYNLEKQDFESYYSRLEWLLCYYMNFIINNELEQPEEKIARGYLKVGHLESRLFTIISDIQEIEEKLKELRLKKERLEKEKSLLEEELATENSTLVNETVQHKICNIPEGILLRGNGTTRLKGKILDKGTYIITNPLVKENVSFALLIKSFHEPSRWDDSEQCRDNLLRSEMALIREEKFKISQKGYYQFCVFATEGIDWEISIKKLSEIEELLDSKLDILNIKRETREKLTRAGIQNVKELTKFSTQSLWGYHINTKEIEDSLAEVGLTLKEPKEIDLLTLEDLNFSVRTYNCLVRSGITNIESLANVAIADLAKIRNLGEKSIIEIKDRLDKLGIELSEKREKDSIQNI